MKWMVTFTVKGKPTSELMALVPQEQARVAELMAQGIVEVRYLAADNTGVWLVMQSDSRDALDALLMSMPMHSYFDIVSTPLR